MMRRVWHIFGIVALLLMQAPAQAHLVTTGLGPVYDGIGHFFLSPDDAIPVIALALLAGLRGKPAGRGVMFQLPLAWFCGGVTGLMAQVEPALPLQCFSFMVLGLLIASDLRLPGLAVMGVALVIGFLHGLLNGVALRAAGAGDGTLELLGIGVMIFVLATVFAALVVSIRVHWARIVVRVAGSWIAAIGLLMLGWALRPGH